MYLSVDDTKKLATVGSVTQASDTAPAAAPVEMARAPSGWPDGLTARRTPGQPVESSLAALALSGCIEPSRVATSVGTRFVR